MRNHTFKTTNWQFLIIFVLFSLVIFEKRGLNLALCIGTFSVRFSSGFFLSHVVVCTGLMLFQND